MPGRTSSLKSPVPKEHVRAKLCLDWFWTSQKEGKGRLFDATGAKCMDTINNVIADSTNGLPELHTALNSLRANPAALFNVLRLFGGCFVPIEADVADDNKIIAGMLGAATEYFERVNGGPRSHADTLALADLFIPLIPAMLGIVEEAAQLRGKT